MNKSWIFALTSQSDIRNKWFFGSEGLGNTDFSARRKYSFPNSVGKTIQSKNYFILKRHFYVLCLTLYILQ